jgi:uncharacterized protein (UPF0147 family)
MKMKFAIRDKVFLKTSQKHWDGVQAEVSGLTDDERYPYNVRLLVDSGFTSYKKGDEVEAFREDELVTAADVLEADVAEAVRLLQKHGITFRLYTREDVDKILDEYAQDPNEPLDTRTFREELVEFIMEGQDWSKLSEKGQDDEVTLWLLVEGARNDHPEWFVG